MNEKELLELCTNKAKISFQIVTSPFWTAEIYGFGKYIREYGHYPSFLPLCIYTDHGPGRIDHPYKHELESVAPSQLYHSPISVLRWNEVSKKPGYCFLSPFVYYRRKNGINISNNAKGTIAFPAHTTRLIDEVSDINNYIDQLLKMPEEFKPVSVCLHMHDINKGRHKNFLNRNIPVVTAGNTSDYRFPERFYDILRKYKYATSNLVGSYTYYAVEMGIPFSVYGEKQKFINHSDQNIIFGEYDPYKESESYRAIYDLFNGLNRSITPEQKKLVETDLGIFDGIGRKKMAKVLYASFLKFIFSRSGFKYILSSTRNRITKNPSR